MTNQPPHYDELSSQTSSYLKESVMQELEDIVKTSLTARLFVPVSQNKDSSMVGTGEKNLQIQIETKQADE